MKQCPKCRTTYPDDSLLYCLADGSELLEIDDQATFVRPAIDTSKREVYGAPMRVQIEADPPRPETAPVSTFPNETSSSWLKIVLILGLVGMMGLIAVVAAGALIYFNRDARPSISNDQNKAANGNKDGNRNSITPTGSPVNSTPAANSETDELREQIANLEKKLNEQKNSNRPVSNSTMPADQPTVTSGNATVNSPGDGFLALRSLPSSDIGERLVRVPHGASLTLGGCLPRSRVGNKTGRWCRANYAGYSGWVFDAWLIY